MATSPVQYLVQELVSLDLPDELAAQLNSLGANGWQLVTVVPSGMLAEGYAGVGQACGIFSRPSPYGTIQATMSDGSATIALPGWQKLNFSQVIQGDATIDPNYNLAITPTGLATFNWNITVTQAQGRTISFGYSWNNGVTITALPTTFLLNTNSPVPLSGSHSGMTLGGTLSLYISTDSTQHAVSWTGSELFCSPAGP